MEAEAIRRVAGRPQSSDSEEPKACDVGGSADEDALRSPLEMEAEASTASSCSADAGASGDTEVAIELARRTKRRAKKKEAPATAKTVKPVGASGRAPGTSAFTEEAEAVRRVAERPQSCDSEEPIAPRWRIR